MAAHDLSDAIIRTARDLFVILDAACALKGERRFYATFKVTPVGIDWPTLFELDHRHWDIPAA